MIDARSGSDPYRGGAGGPTTSRDPNVASDAVSYTDATQHYLSVNRRDPVKTYWEEPLNHRVIAHAVEQLDPVESGVLHVLDVGCGTGDGLRLLESATDGSGLRISYTGLDPDPVMISTARDLHASRRDVVFVEGDVRRDLPAGRFDLYLSTGVPYSHLPFDECEKALSGIFRQARATRGRTAVVVDVLGRYSHEWTPFWGRDRWHYDMSFFAGGAGIDADMSFYCRAGLLGVLGRAVTSAGIDHVAVSTWDRSIVAGRHTSTGAFNPGLPRYRDLLNRLIAGDTTVDVDDLVLCPPRQGAPAEILSFTRGFAARWNGALEQAARADRSGGSGPEARRELAERLRSLESGAQCGLGVGHSLIAVAAVGT